MSGKRGPKVKLTDSDRKRRKKERNAAVSKCRISIGDQIDRWNGVRSKLACETNAEVAKLLLDCYAERQDGGPSNHSIITRPTSKTDDGCSNFVPHGTSTPAPNKLMDRDLGSHSEIISDISADEMKKREDSEMSGIEDIDSVGATCSNRKIINPYSSSFVDPFDLTVYSSEVHDELDDMVDDEYQPSFHLSLRLDHGIPSSDSEEEEEEETIQETEQEVELGPNIKRLKTNDDIRTLLNDHPVFVNTQQLMELARTTAPTICSVKGCGGVVQISMQTVSSAFYLKWVCENGHIANKWCSQPLLNRGLHSTDALLSTAIIASGNNFQKMAMFAKFLKLPFPSQSSFGKLQRTYVLPSIDQIWETHQNELLTEFQGKNLVILGDGRMDSPGHSAQYCTYTFMENSTHKILHIVVMDKRMTGGKSAVLEKACFQKGMQFLLGKGLTISEIVTDAHVQVEALMKREYPNIKHSFDIWHGCKNLGKKIIQAGQEKTKRPLLQWTREIVNHFWFCADMAETENEFIGTWLGVIHHVVNEHEWVLPYKIGSKSKCLHGPLTEEREKGWLEAGSPAHGALRDIVKDKRLLKKVPYYLNCRSTAVLENFQNLILKYSSKRHSYSPPVYKGRNIIAALDHNHNCDRDILKNRDGSLRQQRYFSKKSGRWATYEVKKLKSYPYIEDLMRNCLENRLLDGIGMNKPVVLEADDPRRISAVLAPIPPPPTSQLVVEKKSRFVEKQ